MVTSAQVRAAAAQATTCATYYKANPTLAQRFTTLAAWLTAAADAIDHASTTAAPGVARLHGGRVK